MHATESWIFSFRPCGDFGRLARADYDQASANRRGEFVLSDFMLPDCPQFGTVTCRSSYLHGADESQYALQGQRRFRRGVLGRAAGYAAFVAAVAERVQDGSVFIS